MCEHSTRIQVISKQQNHGLPKTVKTKNLLSEPSFSSLLVELRFYHGPQQTRNTTLELAFLITRQHHTIRVIYLF